jgi:uncharacterized protein YkwD
MVQETNNSGLLPSGRIGPLSVTSRTMNFDTSKALPSRRALALAGLAAAATIALLGAGPGASSAMAAKCAKANATIDEATAAQLKRSVVCLINDKRHDRNKRTLDQNAKLQKAALHHNRTMLQENCWKHKCPGEPRLEKRIRRTGYFDGASRWAFAQNFGCSLTPRGMLNTWMNSAFTRNNILGSYKDIGAAATKETVPSSPCGGDRVTYTVVFAARSG